MARRAFVTLPDGVWNVLDKEFNGVIGDNDSEVIRNIIIAHLTDRGYLIKNKIPANANTIANEMKLLDISVAAIITVLNNSIRPHDSFYEAYKSELAKMAEQQV